MSVSLRHEAFYTTAHDDDAQHLSTTSKFIGPSGAKGGSYWDTSQPFTYRFEECLKVVSSVLSKPHPERFNLFENNAFLAPWFTTKKTYINHIDFNTKVRDLS